MSLHFDVSLLLNMLTYARPMGSITERAFCKTFIGTIPGAYADGCGNWHVHIDDTPVLWSCHTDTVHHLAGRQTVHYNPLTGVVRLSQRSKRVHTCLGADDTAGVAIFAQMAANRIPGHYIFHYGEERGGIGSAWIVKHHAEWLKTFKCAIAVDRKGFSDVITHQYGRCCSDRFATSLAAHLNTCGLNYEASDRGVFTDTANYTDDIGECTNLSCGYFDAHHDTETLHTRHVAKLYKALCDLDTSALTYARKPGEIDPDRWAWVGKTDYYKDYGYAYVHEWPTVPIIDGEPLADVDLAECNNCYADYDPKDSDAIDPASFCDIQCEHQYFSLFLDQSSAQVQSELRKQTLRRVK